MEIVRLMPHTENYAKAILFAQNCSWIAGGHFALLLRENRFTDWEAAFAAIKDGEVIGYCTFLKEDYYPENRYSPWISSMQSILTSRPSPACSACWQWSVL